MLFVYRHSSDDLQGYILDFIIRVANVYRKDQRSCDFIPDILQLKVPNLFSPDNEEQEQGPVADKFSEFLKAYIQRNQLRPVIMRRIQEILHPVSEDKQMAFHWIVLSIVQSVCV